MATHDQDAIRIAGLRAHGRRVLSAVVGLTVGSAGIAVLVRQALMYAGEFPWSGILLFTALSLLLQRSSLHISSVGDADRESVWVGSLVGVMDLAAVISLGAVAGGLVASASGLVYLLFTALLRRRLGIYRLLVVPLFDAGLKAIIAQVSGLLLSTLVALLPLTDLRLQDLPWLLAVCLVWFVLDRLGWGILDLGQDRLTRTRAFSPRVVLLELIPLPMAAVVALTYARLGWAAFGLLALALVLVAMLAQRWAGAHGALAQRADELATLDALGREIAQAQMDVDQLCELMYEQVRRVVDATIFHLGLIERDSYHIRLMVIRGERQPPQVYPLVPGEGLVNWMRTSKRSVLVRDLEREPDQLPAKPTYISDRPPRSVLFVPLMAGDVVIGSLSVQSYRPNAYGSDDLRVVSAMGNQAALAIQKARLYQQEQKRARQLEAIEEVARQVTATLELEELFQRVVRLICDRFGYYHVGVFTVDESRQEVRFEASASAEQQDVAFDVAWGEGLIGWVAQQGETLLVNDVGHEGRYRAVEALDNTRSELAVPLRLDVELVGVLDVQSDQPDAFGADDLFILQTLGDQIAIAIQEARLYEAERQQAWMSTALLQVAEATSQLSDPDEVLETVVRLVPLLAGVERCGIWLWNEHSEEFVPARAHGLSPQLRESFETLRLAPHEIPAFDLVRWQKGPLVVRPEEREALLPPTMIQQFGLQEALVLPLMSKGQLLGAMLADYAGEARSFSEREVRMLTGLANQAAMVIEGARLVQAQQEEVYVSTALLQVAESVNRASSVTETLATVVRITPILVGVDRCVMFLWQERDRALVPVQQYGFQQDLLPLLWQSRLPEHNPLVREMQDGQPYVMLTGAGARAEWWPRELAADGAQAIVGLPLKAREEILGAMFVDSRGAAERFTDRWLGILTGIANQAAIAIEADFLRQEAVERERMGRELEVARQIQVSFLPQTVPDLPGWDIATYWQSARQVGGDFYDLFPLPPDMDRSSPATERWGIVIADVADKGVPAALFMALSRTLFRTVALTGRPAADAAKRANQLILSDARSDLFVTLFYAILQTDGCVQYVNCGHNPPLLVRSNSREVIELRTRGIALGVIDEDLFEQRETRLSEGDCLVLYTDGITEAVNAEGSMFGRARLARLLQSQSLAGAVEVTSLVREAVEDFVGDVPQADDLTLVVVGRERG